MTTEQKLYALLDRASGALAVKDSEEMRVVYDMLDNLEPDHLTQSQNDKCDRMMVCLSDAWEDA